MLYTSAMNSTQKAILNLAGTRNLAAMSLREIGKAATDEDQHPQLIQYHLNRLIEGGFLRHDKLHGVIKRTSSNKDASQRVISVPIVGSANCGVATALAEEHIEGYLHVSRSLLSRRKGPIFAVHALGSSMNRANIDGQPINNGDYVLIDAGSREPRSGKYVLSAIEGAANIKRMSIDRKNEMIVLSSESNDKYPPIYLDANDNPEHVICGEVIKVLRAPT